MNIYSIEEIVKATNSFLEPKVITKFKKSVSIFIDVFLLIDFFNLVITLGSKKLFVAFTISAIE